MAASAKTSPGKPLVCGHRGASGHAPENTLAAFRQALTDGADWIEFDVQLSADNVVIVLHDDTLQRTTNLGQERRPVELTLEQLKALDAGGWFDPQFADERIPTLDEVLAEFQGPGHQLKLGLNIEIKSRPNFEADNGIEQRVAEALQRHGLTGSEQVLVSSFDPFRLAALHKINPAIALGALYSLGLLPEGFDPFQLIPLTGAKAIHPPFQVVDQRLVARAHTEGLAVNTWTVNEASDMQHMIDLQVNMIITNYPARLRALIGHGNG